MKRFVIDASVVLSWFVDRPVSPYASHMKELIRSGSHAVVPTLWHLEIVNGLHVAERRKTVSVTETTDALDQLDTVMAEAIETHPHWISMRRLLLVGRQFHLTAYDAVYLEIARELELPLATLDQKLAKSATEAGIALMT